MAEQLNYHAELDKTIRVFGQAMLNDAPARYFNLETYNLPRGSQISLEQSELFFRDLLTPFFKAGAIFVETADGGGVSVWLPPNFEEPTEGLNSASFQEYGMIAEATKEGRLRGRPYWYLFLIGRDPAYTGPSVATQLIEPFLEKARRDSVPIWLDASSERSRKLYRKLGFQDVEEMRVGQGKSDQEGNVVESGEGVSLWAMVYESDR